MAASLDGRTVAILAAAGVERVELEEPRRALDDAGARTVLVSLASGEIQARENDLADAGTFAVDAVVSDVSVDDYDALLLPGGTVNPDKLRTESAAVDLVRDFVQSGKPVASICHGPWSLIEADVARGLFGDDGLKALVGAAVEGLAAAVGALLGAYLVLPWQRILAN